MLFNGESTEAWHGEVRLEQGTTGLRSFRDQLPRRSTYSPFWSTNVKFYRVTMRHRPALRFVE